jgi:hypothetical protein
MRLPDRLVGQMITPRRRERGAGAETTQEMRKIMRRRFCSPCAAAFVAVLDVSTGTEEYGTGRMECGNLPGRAAVLLVWAVPEGGSS